MKAQGNNIYQKIDNTLDSWKTINATNNNLYRYKLRHRYE